MPAEITVGADASGQAISYRLNKMPVRVQFQVARRLAPVVMHMRGVLGSLPPVDADPAIAPIASAMASTDFLGALEPLVEAIGGLPDETCDYVLDACLSAVQRNQGPAWTPIWNARGKTMQFDDIDLPTMLRLTAAVLQENLGGFFPAPPSGLSPDATA
jgi:hypothetical protein